MIVNKMLNIAEKHSIFEACYLKVTARSRKRFINLTQLELMIL